MRFICWHSCCRAINGQVNENNNKKDGDSDGALTEPEGLFHGLYRLFHDHTSHNPKTTATTATKCEKKLAKVRFFFLYGQFTGTDWSGE